MSGKVRHRIGFFPLPSEESMENSRIKREVLVLDLQGWILHSISQVKIIRHRYKIVFIVMHINSCQKHWCSYLPHHLFASLIVMKPNIQLKKQPKKHASPLKLLRFIETFCKEKKHHWFTLAHKTYFKSILNTATLGCSTLILIVSGEFYYLAHSISLQAIHLISNWYQIIIKEIPLYFSIVFLTATKHTICNKED